MSFTGKSTRSKELEVFANALRACLGLQPLYGKSVSVYKHEHLLPMSAIETDEWFRAVAMHEPESRDERKDRSVALALRSDPLRRYQLKTRSVLRRSTETQKRTP